MNFHSWVGKICIQLMDDVWIRLEVTVYPLLSHPGDALNIKLHTHTLISKPLHLKDWDKSKVFLTVGPGGVRGWGRGWNHAAAAETGQTGLRQAKRHSEGKRERHWAISSQSGCTGPMGEGKGLGAAAFPFLSGWQDDMSREETFFFFFSLFAPQHHQLSSCF